MRSIAIIPARSGSKGLPDKNIKPLNGKPLLAYSIEAALASGMFDAVHVSTDSERYADIARQYGADEPFLRRMPSGRCCAAMRKWASALTPSCFSSPLRRCAPPGTFGQPSA